MACEQRPRCCQSLQVLPAALRSEQHSLELVKKLLAIAVSSITYLRGLFPESAYGSRYVEEQKVMILREERSCPGACQIVQWMQGCFDALTKKYLRMVLLTMYSEPDHPERITECYRFLVRYTDTGPQLHYASHSQVLKQACSDTRKASILLVRKLYTLMQNLGPLPDRVVLSMRLAYYDEVTPDEYEPPGFTAGSSRALRFSREPVSVSVGEVLTPFHSLRLDATTERQRLEQVDDEEPVCVRDRWALRAGEEDQTRVVHDPDTEEMQMSCRDVTQPSPDAPDALEQTQMEAVVMKRTRSGPPVGKAPAGHRKMSPLEFPLSQDIQPVAPKRRKFSVPTERC